MKIMLTLDFPPEPGGIQRYLHAVAVHCYGSGDRIFAGCAHSIRTPIADISARVEWVAFLPVLKNKKPAIIPLFIKLLAIVRKEKAPLHIECGNMYAAIVPWCVSFVQRIPYCVYTHGTEIDALERRPFRRAFFTNILRHAQAVYANSSYTAGLLGKLGLSRRIEIRHPRIDCPPSPPDIPKKGSRASTPCSLLCVGRLVGHKGHRVLLDAVSLLPERLSWRLCIIGTGPLEGRLRDHARGLGIDDRVDFIPNAPDRQLHDRYDAADLFLFPSLHDAGGIEGFGIVLLEAMAHGVPIIASNTGGVPEVLDNGTCGRLVEPGNAVDLARAVEELCDSPSLRESLATAGWERLKRHFSWQAIDDHSLL